MGFFNRRQSAKNYIGYGTLLIIQKFLSNTDDRRVNVNFKTTFSAQLEILRRDLESVSRECENLLNRIELMKRLNERAEREIVDSNYDVNLVQKYYNYMLGEFNKAAKQRNKFIEMIKRL